MLVPPGVVSLVDWATLALSGLIALASLAGALYAVPWTPKARRMAPTRAFNFLWVTRLLLQITGALYALALNLRLQVLWSYRSAVIPGGYQVDAMCRLFIGLTFGVLEPAFLLLVLFACFYAARRQHGDDDDYDGADGGGAGGAGGGDAPRPNLFILALTVGLTLPMCAAQVFAALFSRVITQLRYHEDLMREFFAASVGVPDAMACPPEERANPNCAVCVFPAFSTLISAAFGAVYLLALWAVAGAIARAAINRMLARRVRALQHAVTAAFCLSVALRGATVRFYPYSAGFVALAAADVAVTCALLVAVSSILGWVPVGETRAAGRSLAALLSAQASAQPGGGGGRGGAGGDGLFDGGATELLPLVDHQAGAQYGDDDGGAGGAGRRLSAAAGAAGGGAVGSVGVGGGGGAAARRRGSGEAAGTAARLADAAAV